MTRAAVLALAAFVALFWAVRVVPGDDIYLANGDLFGYFYPAYEGAYARLGAGTLPLWNPYQLCGLPWLATLQTGLFYPPHLVYLLLPVHTGMAISSIGHLLFIALATALFARRVGLGLAPAVLAALLFACRGHMVYLLYWPAAIESAAWLPLGAFATVDLARGRPRRGALLLAMSAGASLLAGYPQNTLYLLYAWATLFLVLLAAERPGLAPALGRTVAFGAALALGALLAGAQLAPTMELTADSVRATRALPLRQIFPMGGGIIGNVAWDFLTHLSLARHPLAFGVPALLLLPLALARGPQRLVALWAAGFGATALLFALGPLTPVFQLLLHLPGLAWFRIPTRALFVVDFCYALLAAAGLEAALGEVGSRRRVFGATALACAMLALVVAGKATPNAGVGAVVIVAATLGLVALRAAGTAVRGVAALVLVAVVAVDLAAAPRRRLRFPFGRDAATMIHDRRALYDELRARLGHDRVWLFTGLPPVDLSPKLPTLFGVRSFDDYEPLVTRRHGEYMTYLWDGATEPSRPPYMFAGYLNTLDPPRGRPDPAERRRLVDLAAVRLIVLPPHVASRPDVVRFVAKAALVPRDPIGDLVAFENPSRVPRAYVTYRVLPAPDTSALLEAVSRPDFDPLAASYAEDPPLLPAANAPARGAAADIALDEERAVEVDAALNAPGLVVLADTFYPGWQATVDGAPARIVAVNHLFRGVAAPAGRHRVRFEYHPASVRRGLAASAAGLVLLVGLAVSGRRRRVPPPPR